MQFLIEIDSVEIEMVTVGKYIYKNDWKRFMVFMLATGLIK